MEKTKDDVVCLIAVVVIGIVWISPYYKYTGYPILFYLGYYLRMRQ